MSMVISQLGLKQDALKGEIVVVTGAGGGIGYEAARALRSYRRKLDLDPKELQRVEQRLAAIHDVARKYRLRPEALPDLLAATEHVERGGGVGHAHHVDPLEPQSHRVHLGAVGVVVEEQNRPRE